MPKSQLPWKLGDPIKTQEQFDVTMVETFKLQFEISMHGSPLSQQPNAMKKLESYIQGMDEWSRRDRVLETRMIDTDRPYDGHTMTTEIAPPP